MPHKSAEQSYPAYQDGQGDYHVVPMHEDEPEHRCDKTCWCEPQIVDYTAQNGRKVYVHKRPN